MARERFARILTFLEPGNRFSRSDYHYLTGDIIRAEVLERFQIDREDMVVISRNSYDAAVLNAKQVLFIHIDVRDYEPGVAGFLAGLRRLFTKAAPKDYFAAMLDKIRTWQAQHPQYTLRVYRTRAGYRCVVLNEVFSDAGKAKEILTWVVTACISVYAKSSSASARLTPEP